MIVAWHQRAWEDYLYWQVQDAKMVRKINELLKDISRSPFKGLGQPEPLRENRSGYWSRRISQEHRLVYRIAGSGEDQRVEVAQCRFHY